MDLMQALERLLNPANAAQNTWDAAEAFARFPGSIPGKVPKALDNMSFYDDPTPQAAPAGVPAFDPITGRPATVGGFSDQAPTGFGPSATNPNVGPGLEARGGGGGGIVGGGPIPSPEAVAGLMPSTQAPAESSPSDTIGPALDVIAAGGGGSSPVPTSPESTPGGGGSSPVPEQDLPEGAQRRGDAITYTIQPGDSLSLIGAMFGLTYDELIAGNEELLGEKGKATVIHPGQEILVSPPVGRGTEARKGVADKGFSTPEEAAAYSKARRG